MAREGEQLAITNTLNESESYRQMNPESSKIKGLKFDFYKNFVVYEVNVWQIKNIICVLTGLVYHPDVTTVLLVTVTYCLMLAKFEY